LDYFFHGSGHAKTLTKNGWASFWAIFLQTNLVTLPIALKSSCRDCRRVQKKFPPIFGRTEKKCRATLKGSRFEWPADIISFNCFLSPSHSL
jgi:hypothetical protein